MSLKAKLLTRADSEQAGTGESAKNTISEPDSAPADGLATAEQAGTGAPARVDGRFSPGTSGNPAGRPKGVSLAAFRERLAEHEDAVLSALLEEVNDAGGKNRVKAIEIACAYLYGKPAQSLQVSTPEGEAIRTEAKAVIAAVDVARDPSHFSQVAQILHKIGVLPPLPTVSANLPILQQSTPTDGLESHPAPEGSARDEAGFSPAVPPGSSEPGES